MESKKNDLFKFESASDAATALKNGNLVYKKVSSSKIGDMMQLLYGGTPILDSRFEYYGINKSLDGAILSDK